MKKNFTVTGMGCAKCVSKVKVSVSALDGVTDVEVSLENKSLTCEADISKVTDGDIIKAVTKVGFRASAK